MQRRKASEISAFSGEAFAFDANVLLFVYFADPREPEAWRTAYSRLLKTLLAKDCHLFLEQSVLSEVVNRISRKAYDRWRTRELNQSFKDFRNSSAFTPCADDIELTVTSILNDHELKCHAIAKSEAALYPSLMVSRGLDWTDLTLVDFCKTHSAYLVTHDSDFRDETVDIVTENPKLLQD